MILHADARALPLRAGCVDCVVTSPPYWGLRDYGTATWEGGDPACDHIEKRSARRDSPGGYHNSRNDRIGARQPSTLATVLAYRDVCGRCGAVRRDAQLGLEPTPDAYVAALVGVFRDVARVLKPGGTVWLNLGDSYAAHPGQRKTTDLIGWKQATNVGSNTTGSRSVDDLKAKDLVGIPWRVAFALQADGWYLRSDIIWHKPNPMPESVTDRPTKAHEYVFLLTRSARYFYDAAAIAEATTCPEGPGNTRPYVVPGERLGLNANKGGSVHLIGPRECRNKRSVWTIPTLPYAGAHFATMPEALVEPCILAGCPLGGLVLDPFLGSGTVGAVAERLGRRWVGCDLAYHDLSSERTAQRGLRFELAIS